MKPTTTQARPGLAGFFDALHPVFVLPAVIVVWTTLDMALRYCALPWIDQWQFLDEYRQLLDHGFSLDWLFASHNGHRMATARPLYLMDLAWFGGHNTFLIVCIWLTEVAGAALFVKLRGDVRQLPNAFALALAIGVLFSLVAWQNFTQGFQVQFVGVLALGAWCCATFIESLFDGSRRRFALSLALLVLATFSMANGFLAGAAAAAVGLLARKRVWASAVFAVATAVLAWFYIQGPGVDHPPVACVLSTDWVLYVAMYLGSVWAYPQPPPINDAALVAGVLGLILTAAAVIRVARRPQPREAALLAIMLFVVLSAMLTALARVDLGADQAVDSRYASSSAYFWATVAVFWGGAVPANRPHVRRAALGAVGLALCALIIPLQLVGDNATWRFQRVATWARGDLLNGNDVPGLKILSNGDGKYYAIYVRPNSERNLALLRQRHLSVFSR
jgi:hypothetical protein